MSRSDDVTVQGESGDRVLNLGAVRVHNRHLRSGISSSAACQVCSNGLEGAMETVRPRDKADEVAPSDGADEKEDPALPLSDWADQ